MALTIKQIETALIQTDGNITEAAKGLGVTRQALHLRIRDNEALQAVCKDAREALCDLAESAARQQIREGNTAIIIFTLKTLGKERGYVERSEITGKDGGAIETRELSKLTDEELERIASGSGKRTT